MNQSFFVKLTLAVYRVAELLPARDELKTALEASSARLLASLLMLSELNPISAEQKRIIAPRALQELKILKKYLQEGQEKQTVNPDNFRILEKEYNKLKGLFAGLEKHERIPERTHSLSSRQQKIVEFLKYKDKAQVWEFKRILPEVTKRTLRRDLDDLLQKGLVAREGEWNAIFYRLPRQEQERNVEKV